MCKCAAGCAFHWRQWELQADWSDLITASKMQKSQTERIERARAAGDTTGTIARLSTRSQVMQDATASYWNGKAVVEPTSRKVKKHGGAYSKARAA